MASNGIRSSNAHKNRDSSEPYSDTEIGPARRERGPYNSLENPIYVMKQTSLGDAYVLNQAYNAKSVSSRPSRYQPESPAKERATRKAEHDKRMKNFQFCVAVAVILVVVLLLALGLGLGFGLSGNDDGNGASSRLQYADPNKVPDATANVIIEDMEWDNSMADTKSSTFKRSADVIERSMDSYFERTPMTEIYDYAIVSRLWQGSVGCSVWLYLKPPTASTSQEMKDLYNTLKNASGEQRVKEFLKEGQDDYLSQQTSHPYTVMFKTDTFKLAVPTTTTTKSSTVTSAPTNIITSSTVTNAETSTNGSTTTSGEMETTSTASSMVSTFAVFSIVNREFTGNLSDKFSGEYLAAAELIKKEIKETLDDIGEGQQLVSISVDGFWLSNRLTETTLMWNTFNISDIESFREKFTTAHKARVESDRSNISFTLEDFSLKQEDDCPHIFPDECYEYFQTLNISGHSQMDVCGTYGDIIQCLYLNYQTEGFSMCNKSTLDKSFKHYSEILMDIYSANITFCDSEKGNPVELAAWINLTVNSIQWNDSLKERTSSQFKSLAKQILGIVSQVYSNITVLDIVSFNREKDTVSAHTILSTQTYDKVDLSTLFMRLKMRLQSMNQSSNTSLLDLTDVQWVTDWTAVVSQTELWIWYNSKWNPVCENSFSASALNVACHQLGYKQGYIFEGVFREMALKISNLTCDNSLAQSSLLDCTSKFTDVSQAACTVTNVNCFNAVMQYDLYGGGTTYGYVEMKWDGEDGLISTSYEHSYSMATYLCRDINSTFYGGMNMQTSKLLQPAEKNVWNVSANCYRPERDSTFLDCVHLGLQFVKNVTYYSDSSSRAITQLPFMPDVCQAKTTLVSAINPDNVVNDAWLIKVNCHSQPIAIYQGPESNVGYILATNSSDPIFFCRDNFTDLEAAAACKTLGYSTGGMSLMFNPIPWFSSTFNKFSNFDYHCLENNTIEECNKTQIDVAKRTCSGPAVVKCVNSAATEKDWDLKLDSDGYTVLVYYKGQWGTICIDQSVKPWSSEEAKTVCTELGYTYGVPVTRDVPPDVPPPHVISHVTCPASANKLSNCSYTEINSDSCTNSYAAKVFCYNSTDVAKLEFVPGKELNSGMVKVTWEKQEGYLCSRRISDTASTVMCHSFGFTDGVQDTDSHVLNLNLNYIWQTDFDGQCDRDDVLAENCRSAIWVKHPANLSQTDMNCVCNGSYVSLYCFGKVKVSYEPRKNYGPLLIYNVDGYYPVCNDDLTQAAANAACREVTRLNTSNAVILNPLNFLLMDKSKQDVLFNCTEESASVSKCVTFKTQNFDCLEATLSCYDGMQIPGPAPENSTEWSIENGAVLLKAYGLWGTVCRDDWSDREATALCITLDGEYTIGRAYGDVRQSLVPMWLSSVICDVNATDINTCTRATDSLTLCQFSEAAMTVCFRGESDVPTFMLKDVEKTAFYDKGHPAITRNTQTGYYCAPANAVDANFLCGEIGYIGGGMVSQDKISRFEYNSFWSGSYHCNDQRCVLIGNFTVGMGGNFTVGMGVNNTNSSGTGQGNCDFEVPNILCFSSKVRLQEPELKKGLLLVYGTVHGWQGVCKDGFTSELAEKFCNEAGYQSGNFSLKTPSEGGPWAAYEAGNCDKNSKFAECTFTELKPGDCNEIIYVSCTTCLGNCTQSSDNTMIS